MNSKTSLLSIIVQVMDRFQLRWAMVFIRRVLEVLLFSFVQLFPAPGVYSSFQLGYKKCLSNLMI